MLKITKNGMLLDTEQRCAWCDGSGYRDAIERKCPFCEIVSIGEVLEDEDQD